MCQTFEMFDHIVFARRSGEGRQMEKDLCDTSCPGENPLALFCTSDTLHVNEIIIHVNVPVLLYSFQSSRRALPERGEVYVQIHHGHIHHPPWVQPWEEWPGSGLCGGHRNHLQVPFSDAGQ